jgi:ribosomal protein L11 methyltransferase
VRSFPALQLTWSDEPSDEARDIAVAVVDEAGPTAVETLPLGLRIFFRSAAERDAAAAMLRQTLPDLTVSNELVPDDDWAARSQAAITAIAVGRLRVCPPWLASEPHDGATGATRGPADEPIEIVIQPSMGFGTGHHATTRLCLTLLQAHLVAGQAVLDVGTGSGLLAIAARRLGAGAVLGIDVDPDALENARENRDLNRAPDVEFVLADIGTTAGLTGRFGLILANLTGSLLCRTAPMLSAGLSPGGVLIASGFQTSERDAVTAAFAAAGSRLLEERTEQDWVGSAFSG